MKNIVDKKLNHIIVESAYEQDAIYNSARLLKRTEISGYLLGFGYRSNISTASSTSYRKIDLFSTDRSYFNKSTAQDLGNLCLPHDLTSGTIECLSAVLSVSIIRQRIFHINPVKNISMLNDYWESVGINS